MYEIVGRHNEGLVTLKQEYENTTILFWKPKNGELVPRTLVEISDESIRIVHVSLQIICKTEENDGEKEIERTLYLISLVQETNSSREKCQSLSLLLIEDEQDNINIANGSTTIPKVLEEVSIIQNVKDKEIRAHLLPTITISKKFNTYSSEDIASPDTFNNSLVVLILEEGVNIYHTSDGKLELLFSEIVAKSFWWAQWNSQYQFLAFAHHRKRLQSSFDDEEPSVSTVIRPLLSVLQFHEKYPRETVLNIPLDLNLRNTTTVSKLGLLVQDPMILTSSCVQLKMLSHSSGAVNLFQINSEDDESSVLSYNVNMLHHNKDLCVKITIDKSQVNSTALRIDCAMFNNDQFLLVVGWPIFAHVLDIGSSHEPSHHLVFDFKSLCICPTPQHSFFCLLPDTDNKNVSFVLDDFSTQILEINSAVLLPLFPKANIKFKQNVVHFLLIHSSDKTQLNAAKRIIYDEGRNMGNLQLNKIYQEFLLALTYFQTRKQLMANMEEFLKLLPYCPFPEEVTTYDDKQVSISVSVNPLKVSTMLLSPRQRIFPHNITDVWTCLWENNNQAINSNRFQQSDVAEKLLLSLQCYKPEALSRCSTPMSPASPMIAGNLNDIAGIFGRRMELQLPFHEHESCTANKQEYIFSINLRELSMHLLKEKKDWPVHSHNVAVKYSASLMDTARLLCHLVCLTSHLQTSKKDRDKDKGFRLIDSLSPAVRLRVFMLLEHYSLALNTLACPLPQGFATFFTYLGYRVVPFDQFIWHIQTGTFDLQIDLLKTIMADLKDSEEENITKKLHLLSLLPKSRASRVLNGWGHPKSISIRARQHASDLLSGVAVSQSRKSIHSIQKKKKVEDAAIVTQQDDKPSALDTFLQLLTAKANASDIDKMLLTEATLLSMKENSALPH